MRNNNSEKEVEPVGGVGKRTVPVPVEPVE